MRDYEERMEPMYNKVVRPARSMCKYTMSDSRVIQGLLRTWIKYGPAAYLAPEVASAATVNDITKYL